MGYGSTWVTSLSLALVASAESCQAPAPLLPPPRNAAGAEAKNLPGWLPASTHRGWEDKGGARGATGNPSAAAILGWQQEAAHPTASPCACALGRLHPWVPRNPQHPEYTLAQDAGRGSQSPVCPIPCSAPHREHPPARHHPALVARCRVGAAMPPPSSAQPEPSGC